MTTFIERLLAVVADGPQPAADARSADVSGVEDRRGSAEMSATGTAEVSSTGTALGANAGRHPPRWAGPRTHTIPA